MQKKLKSLLGIKIFFILSLISLITNGAAKGQKIVGGEEAEPYTYPFMVSIQNKNSGRHFCGGALISPNTVITAAHCTVWANSDRIQVVLSEHDLTTDEGVEQVRDVSKIIIHDKYDARKYKNDISILQLSEPVEINDKAQLIALPQAGEEVSGKITAIGWGALKQGGPSPDILNQVNVDIVSFDECNENYSGKIFDGMICAGAPGKDSCQGDSGGPLFKDNKLIGLTSWGRGCAQPDYPGVYTQVSKYIDFINKNIIW